MTASLGVAVQAKSLTDSSGLIDHADSALYAAKRAGRNRVSVDDSGVGPIQQSAGGKGQFSLPVTQEALDVRIESGWGQHLSIVLSNNSDQAFAVIGVSVEYEGTTLGAINRPEKDTA